MSLWKSNFTSGGYFLLYIYTSNYNLVTACKVEINTGYSDMKKRKEKQIIKGQQLKYVYMDFNSN